MSGAKKQIAPLTDDQHMLLASLVEATVLHYSDASSSARANYLKRVTELQQLVDGAEDVK